MLIPGVAHSSALSDDIRYNVYLPEGYDGSGERYPSVYLLHGRGGRVEDWREFLPDLDDLIDSGAVPPLIAIMPDAPWGRRAGFYVDSLFTGHAIEAAFTRDLISHIDDSLRTIAGRRSRAVAGYSMGGAGAVRFVSAHPDLFSAAIALSPASYVPLPPTGSSAREFGAFGAGGRPFDASRYEQLGYPRALARFTGDLPVTLFIGAGDAEYAQPLAEDFDQDLDQVAATLHNHARRTPGVTSSLRIYGGGHGWDTWRQGMREGLQVLGRVLGGQP